MAAVIRLSARVARDCCERARTPATSLCASPPAVRAPAGLKSRAIFVCAALKRPPRQRARSKCRPELFFAFKELAPLHLLLQQSSSSLTAAFSSGVQAWRSLEHARVTHTRGERWAIAEKNQRQSAAVVSGLDSPLAGQPWRTPTRRACSTRCAVARRRTIPRVACARRARSLLTTASISPACVCAPSLHSQVEVEFHGAPHLISVATPNDETLVVEVEDAETLARWRGEFSAKCASLRVECVCARSGGGGGGGGGGQVAAMCTSLPPDTRSQRTHTHTHHHAHTLTTQTSRTSRRARAASSASPSLRACSSPPRCARPTSCTSTSSRTPTSSC